MRQRWQKYNYEVFNKGTKELLWRGVEKNWDESQQM